MVWNMPPSAPAPAPTQVFTPAPPTQPTQPQSPLQFTPAPPTQPAQTGAAFVLPGAALPPVQPAAPVTPAAPQQAATVGQQPAPVDPVVTPPARRGRRSAAAAQAAAAVAAPAAPQVAQQVIQQVAPQPSLPATQPPALGTSGLIIAGAHAMPGFLSKFNPPPSGQGLAYALIQGSQSQGEPNIFPTNFIVGGDQGGMLKVDEMNEEGSDANLRDGSKPQFCVVIGYRSLLNAWPKAYDKNDKNRAAPKWKAQIGSDSPHGLLVSEALKNYTYRNRDLSSLFDAYGHLQMSVEFLCYDEKIGFFCTRTTTDYDSCIQSMAGYISGLAPSDPNDPMSAKVYSPYPARIDILYKDQSSKLKNQHWKSWFFQFTRFFGPETTPAAESFNQMLQSSVNDPELNALMDEWGGTTLRPEHLQLLQAISEVAAR